MAEEGQAEERWQPLSVREGRVEAPGPFEGIPPHLTKTVDEWLERTLRPSDPYGPETVAESIALRLQVTGDGRYTRSIWLRNAAIGDEDKALDIVDAALLMTRGRTASSLKTSLGLAGSVWEVNDKKTGLSRRVSTTEQASYTSAASPADAASEQLQIAWSKVYGRNPDFSDAWDHAIKACEALLAPIVAPKSPTPTLGSIISGIEAKPPKYRLGLPSSSKSTSNVETFIGMLRLIWPNPDRHETGASRPPTEAEARHVLHLAVLVVNWVRQGGFSEA